MNKGRARIFEISGEDNRDNRHVGFIKRQEFLPLEDGLSFIRDEIQHSGCEYFNIRIYNNQDAAIRAHNHAKKGNDVSLLYRAAEYIKDKRLLRLWNKNCKLVELLREQGRYDRNDFLDYINDIDSVVMQKNLNKALKAALKKEK